MSHPRRRDLLIIGGGRAGAAAIKGFRRHNANGQVTLVSREDSLPYHRPALSKEFLRGAVHAADLPIESPDFYDGVDLRLGVAATTVDPVAQEVGLADGQQLAYTTCILATGSRPTPAPVPGGDNPGLFMLRSLASAHRLRAAVAIVDSAVVVGSGFIGCEAAISMARLGLRVTLVSPEPLPQNERLGEPVAKRIAEFLAEEGVDLRQGIQVDAIPDAHHVVPRGQDAIRAGVVLVAIGATPDNDLALQAGLSMKDGRAVVDERMRSSVPNVYVAGDVALAHNAAAGRRLVVEHWGEAQRMGEVAGAVCGGADEQWAQVPGFWTQLGDRTLKQVAWGDGYDSIRIQEHGQSAFTAWYGQAGRLVGALTYNADSDYERARLLIEQKAPVPTA